MIFSNKFFLILLSLFAGVQLFAAPPVPFSGKLAVDGTNFHGHALFSFSIVDGGGTVHWKHAEEPDSKIENFVMNGRYLVLLGGQGMQTLPADLFLQHESLFLRVSVDLKDGQGMRLLEPDQRITSSPYALSAEIARLAERAQVAGGVDAGAITADMLEQALLADLNRTSEIGGITRDMLPQDVRDELNATITRDRLSADVRADLNRTIGITNLSSEVTNKLNQTFSIDPGSITLDQLSQQVRADINRTITRDRLSSDVLSDINRTITKSMLSQEVLDELNASRGATGSVPGSLIAVPANQSAPSGYELYQMGDRKELVWEEKAPLSVARYAFDGVEVLDGKIYFVGGENAGTFFDTLECFDPGTNSWQTLAPMSSAREGVATAVLDGKLYAIGGRNNSDVTLSSVEIYDPITNSWSNGPSIPTALRYLTAINIEQELYIFGGRTGSNSDTNQVFCLDTASGQWIAKANISTARHGVNLLYFENRIWAIGGRSNTNIVESYDPDTNSWRAETPLGTERGWNSPWVANRTIFVAGGNSNNGVLNTIEKYDPVTKTWSVAGSFPENRWTAGTIVLNGIVYVIAGHDGSSYSNKVFAADLNASVGGVHDLYVKTGDASTGTPTVQVEVADGSIGPSKLSSEVSNALKPVVVGQPSSVVGVSGTSAYLTVVATGGDNTYQWKKNGADIAGVTSSTLSIADLNASQHEGNYTVVVSNAFGSVTSSVAQIDVNGSLTEGLVGWWKFDETEGTVASDSSGNGNGGTLTNGPTWTEGKIGGALSFDGVDDFVNLGNKSEITLIHNKTFSMWLRPASFDARRNPYNKAYGGTGTFTLEVNQRLNYFYGTSGSDATPYTAYSTSVGAFSLNNWTLVTLVRDLSSLKIIYYLDGILDKEMTADYSVAVAGSESAYIGKGYESNFHGLLDDIRIYDRALSAVEVKALYELGGQPVQASGSGTTTVVNGTVADGSITASKIADQTITTDQLSEQILKYLKPEITQQPIAGTIFADTNHTISVSAEGKYLTYQWKKNGVNLAGETNATLTITDANATQHDGNYSVVVSNDFGSVESGLIQVLISNFNLRSISELELWLDGSATGLITHSNNSVSQWIDKSDNNLVFAQSTQAAQPTYDSINSKVSFVNQSLTTSLVTMNMPLTFFTVSEFTIQGTDTYLFHDSQDGRFILGYSGEKGLSIHSNSQWLMGEKQNVPNHKSIHSYIFDTSTSSLYSNGSLIASGTTGTASMGGNYTLGARYSGTQYYIEGSIYEHCIYSAKLTTEQREKVEGYLAHKWGIESELPSDHPYKHSAP